MAEDLDQHLNMVRTYRRMICMRQKTWKIKIKYKKSNFCVFLHYIISKFFSLLFTQLLCCYVCDKESAWWIIIFWSLFSLLVSLYIILIFLLFIVSFFQLTFCKYLPYSNADLNLRPSRTFLPCLDHQHSDPKRRK